MLATADSAWLSTQLENGSSRPRAFEAAERGKHAYPDSGLKIKLIQDSGLRIAESTLEGGTSPYHLRFLANKIVHNIVGSLPLAKNALHSPTSTYYYALHNVLECMSVVICGLGLHCDKVTMFIATVVLCQCGCDRWRDESYKSN